MLVPQKIFDSIPKCRRVITSAHLQYLSSNIIQTPGSRAMHPHFLVLKKEFPTHLTAFISKITDHFPGKRCKIRDSLEKIACCNRIYLRVQVHARLIAEMEFCRRSAVAKAIKQIMVQGTMHIRKEVEMIKVESLNNTIVVK